MTKYPRPTILPFLVCFFLGIHLHAETIASFENDFSLTPKAGWVYQWNPAGVKMGNRSEYVNLKAHEGRMEVDASSMHGVKQGKVPNARGLKIESGLMMSGIPAADSTDDFDHFAIAGYEIQLGDAGILSIMGGYLEQTTPGEAVQIMIFVNDDLVAHDVTTDARASQFDLPLGRLRVGDVVYIAIGPNEQGPASVKVRFQLEKAR